MIFAADHDIRSRYSQAQNVGDTVAVEVQLLTFSHPSGVGEQAFWGYNRLA